MHAAFDHFQLYQEYLAAGLKHGEKTAWYEKKAQELGVTTSAIVAAIASQRDDEFFGKPEARLTPFQVLAREVGATAAAALQKYKEKLEAKRKTRVHDRDGNYVAEYDDDDNRVQLAAAEKILKLHNALSEKFEINVTGGIDNLSEEELDKLIEEKAKKLNAGNPG